MEAWAKQARTKLLNGGLHEVDLDALLVVARARRRRTGDSGCCICRRPRRAFARRLLAWPLHEPEPNSITQISPDATWPYATVHDAILDGWQVISFPQQRVPFDDREIDVLGYEFILQKMQEVSHG